MEKYSYLVGTKINGIYISYLGKKEYGKAQYLNCICICGASFSAQVYHILNGHSKTCGHCIKGKDYSGIRFNKLLVKNFSHNKGKFPIYDCLCDCGNNKKICIYSLLSGQTKSCGCLHLENITQITHGMSKNPFYSIYTGIKKRCTNNKYKTWHRYGGRGIKCEWKSFDIFKNDMYGSYLEHIEKYGKKNTSIDRIDNDGNYCKNNCRRATNKEQSENKSTSMIFTYNNKTQSLIDWCIEYNIPYKRVYYRMKRFGWLFEKSIKTPIKDKFKNTKYKL